MVKEEVYDSSAKRITEILTLKPSYCRLKKQNRKKKQPKNIWRRKTVPLTTRTYRKTFDTSFDPQNAFTPKTRRVFFFYFDKIVVMTRNSSLRIFISIFILEVSAKFQTNWTKKTKKTKNKTKTKKKTRKKYKQKIFNSPVIDWNRTKFNYYPQRFTSRNSK